MTRWTCMSMPTYANLRQPVTTYDALDQQYIPPCLLASDVCRVSICATHSKPHFMWPASTGCCAGTFVSDARLPFPETRPPPPQGGFACQGSTTRQFWAGTFTPLGGTFRKWQLGRFCTRATAPAFSVESYATPIRDPAHCVLSRYLSVPVYYLPLQSRDSRISWCDILLCATRAGCDQGRNFPNVDDMYRQQLSYC